jgi:hypothetical protein
MTTERRIAFLEDTHRMLNKKIDEMSKSGAYEDLEIAKLKKKRLQIKEELVKLQEQQKNS